MLSTFATWLPARVRKADPAVPQSGTCSTMPFLQLQSDTTTAMMVGNGTTYASRSVT